MHHVLLLLPLALAALAGASQARVESASAAPSPNTPLLSVHIVTERIDALGTRRLAGQTLLRIDGRAALVPDGSRREWVFERNGLDPRRVSGYLIDHAARQIVVYQESDLRNRERLGGWADVWHIRFDPRELQQMTRTGETSWVGGVSFVRYRRGRAASGTVLVDWNEEHGLPGRMEIRDAEGLTVLRVDRLTRPVDATAVEDPRVRYRDYEVLDVSDLEERRH